MPVRRRRPRRLDTGAVERYREMGIAAALSRPWDYPTACGELAALLRVGYADLPKASQALVAGDVLLALRLLSEEDEMDPFFENFLQDESAQIVWPNSPHHAPPPPATEGAARQPARKNKGNKPNRTTERTKWTATEDEVLVSAWLNVSLDPIVGKDQSSDTYWSRIADYFNTNRKDQLKERSMKGMVNRWSLINESVSKYAGFLSQTDGLNQSGTTERDRMAHAARMFQDIEGKAFAFHHCWLLLANHPKWSSHVSHKKQKTHEGSNDIPIDLGSQASSEEGARPPGREAAKAARKRACTSSMSYVGAYSEHLEKLNETKAALIQLKLEKNENSIATQTALVQLQREKNENEAVIVQIKREKWAMSKEVENERIMKVDLSTCSAALREYYQDRQDEILKSRRNRNN